MTTPFEDSTGASWTSIAEESAYVDAILADGNIQKLSLGSSVQGRELYALRVGAPSAAGSPLLIECAMHGNEPAVREAALTWARDLAASEDPTVSTFLDSVPVIIVPTVNPDGFVAGTRTNANGVDLNRNAEKLTEPEAMAIARLTTDTAPVGFLSVHEVPSTTPGPNTNLELNPNTFIGIAEDNYDASVATCLHVMGEMTTAGISNDWYTFRLALGMFVQSVALAGATTALLEVNANSNNGGTPWQRHGWAREALDSWLSYSITNHATLSSIRSASRAEAATRALEPSPQWAVSGWRSTPQLGATTPAYVTATGYRLTGAQYSNAEEALEAWGIESVADGTGRIVWLNQPAALNAVATLDPSSGSRLLSATRLTDTPPPTINRRRGASVVGLI